MTRPVPEDAVTVGVDYGTLSGRAVVVRVSDGTELGTAVHAYPHAVLDRELPASGERLPPDWALQVPDDYRAVLRHAVPEALKASGVRPEQVIGIGTDFTACTILPVDADGTPLSELDAFRDRPHAYTKLWKHHAAQPQADRINALARERNEFWLDRYGGKLSSEWALAKALELLAGDREIYERMAHFIEAADWIVWQLTGQPTRNRCAAGYKAVLQDGAVPEPAFLDALVPGFGGFYAQKMTAPLVDLGSRVGGLSAEAAGWTGLPEAIAVCAGNVDAHVTAPAAGVTRPGQLLAVMGTSTCHVVNGAGLAEVAGMCGVVDGGLVPGTFGYEAGQSGVGDIFAWFVEQQVPGELAAEASRRGIDLHELLSEQGSEEPVGAHGLLALDWHSGNRSVLVDHELSGLVVGLTLATRPHEIYRALLESTAFGTRRIIDAFTAAGIAIEELVVAGGLLRNRVLMQVYADVTRRPLSLLAAEHGPALGAAMHAAVAAGAFPDIHAAAAAMAKVDRAVYRPDPVRADAYDALYEDYLLLHDHFGRGGNDVMRRLKARRREVAS